MSASRRIIVVDGEPAFAATLKNMLDSLGFDVATATDALTKLAFGLRDSDIIFLDIGTGKLSWHELLKQLAHQKPPIAIVLMGSQFELLQEAEKVAKKLKLNLIGAIEKPFRIDDLRDILPPAQ